MKLTHLASSTLLTAAIAATMGFNAYATDESFDSTLRLIEPITITEVTSLRFPEQQAGTAQNLTVQPSESGAAQFNSAGEPARPVTASIVESQIVMETTAGDQITVNNFTYGGQVDPAGNGAFNDSGALNNIRIGATALIEADDKSGLYSGIATFRLVYL